jgi:hypothetical protein
MVCDENAPSDLKSIACPFFPHLNKRGLTTWSPGPKRSGARTTPSRAATGRTEILSWLRERESKQ